MTEQREASQTHALNRLCMTLSRCLIPVTYTLAGRFDHDPAWGLPHLPGLAGAPALASLDPAGDDYQFLRTRLVRNRNQVEFALREALDALNEAGFSQHGEE
jgi:N-acetylated-alpha-linked acidic dipeptidase